MKTLVLETCKYVKPFTLNFKTIWIYNMWHGSVIYIYIYIYIYISVYIILSFFEITFNIKVLIFCKNYIPIPFAK
jgi:hypothetical protein